MIFEEWKPITVEVVSPALMDFYFSGSRNADDNLNFI